MQFVYISDKIYLSNRFNIRFPIKPVEPSIRSDSNNYDFKSLNCTMQSKPHRFTFLYSTYHCVDLSQKQTWKATKGQKMTGPKKSHNQIPTNVKKRQKKKQIKEGQKMTGPKYEFVLTKNKFSVYFFSCKKSFVFKWKKLFKIWKGFSTKKICSWKTVLSLEEKTILFSEKKMFFF